MLYSRSTAPQTIDFLKIIIVSTLTQLISSNNSIKSWRTQGAISKIRELNFLKWGKSIKL